MKNLIKNSLLIEASAIVQFAEGDLSNCETAISEIYNGSGLLLVAGIGKSGHIARKVASTFCSLGKPAVFLHGSEASHGDLGLVKADSVLLILSNSGETTELSDLLCYCMDNGIKIISITSSVDSTLAKASLVTIATGKVKEACGVGLAPTTSTTLALAIGDILAIGVSHLSGMVESDFSRYHPGGRLGAWLLRVKDVMQTGDALPIVKPAMTMSEVVVIMSEKRLGMAVLEENRKVIGVITDGDLRRNVDCLWKSKALDIATLKPVEIDQGALVSEAVRLMYSKAITSCLVKAENGELIGIIHINDCLRYEVIR